MRHLFGRGIIFIALLFTFSANAHPALSQEMRTAEATDIVTGKVLSTTSEVLFYRWHNMGDRIYTVTMEVINVLKGNLMPSSVIEVTYWQALDRPYNYSGDMGQYNEMIAGETVTTYMNALVEGQVYSLLSPNGFDR